ncbi:hypothetical protein [Sorangium sp. So ce1182]|uniref:hypothetical protein n=1 Tax=Sorangium sp. So ce1182 TaxID=3133334 RepID=UPI003F648C20
MGTGTSTSTETTTNASSAASPAAKAVGIRTGALQTPPDVKLTIRRGTSIIIKVASLGATPRGNYLKNVEYWRQAGGAVFDATANLELKSQELLEDTQGEIDTLLQSTPEGFSHGRLVDIQDWHAGQRTIPTGRAGYLFSSPSPDSTQIRVCLLIEVSTKTQKMVAATWYRSTAPEPNKYQIWNSTSFDLIMTPVKAGGVATTNPRAIAGYENAAWHHTSMGSL